MQPRQLFSASDGVAVSETPKAVDAEPSLPGLLPTRESESLCLALSELLACPVALQDLAGTVCAGVADLPADARVELLLEGQAIGYLQASRATATARRSAATLIENVLLALAQAQARHQALAAEQDKRMATQMKQSDDRQRQSYQAERLASVGELAAGVAHEINNPIAFVRSNLSTGQTYLAKLSDLVAAVKALPGGDAILTATDAEFALEDFADLLTDSIGGVDRVARIVSDLKGFSNIDKPEEDVVDVNQLLGSACKMAEKKLLPGARLVCELRPLKPLLCLPGHLAQAFLAILTNAVQAIEGKGASGELRVESRFDGQQVLIVVSDNGVGIERDSLPRVFDPFYTTRPVGKGTGLGLTVTRDIVRAHGGEIEFDSVPEIGTTVTVRLPD